MTRLVVVLRPEFAHLATAPVVVAVEQRKQDRRRGRGRDHGKRARQRRQRRLVIYPPMIIVEDVA